MKSCLIVIFSDILKIASPQHLQNDLDIFPDEIADKCEKSLYVPSDRDSDSAIDYSNYKLDVRNRKTKNLEDEDVKAYFYDVVGNSDSDSESQEHFPDFDEYDDLFDKDISKSEHRIAERKNIQRHILVL